VNAMKLTAVEVGTPVWHKIMAYYEPKLVKHRDRIENPRITEAERIEIAWRIAGIKELIALGNLEPERKQQVITAG